MGKRLFFLILFVCCIFTAMFWRTAITCIADHLVEKVVREKLGMTLQRKGIHYTQGKFVLTDVEIEKLEAIECSGSIKRVEITPFWEKTTLHFKVSLHSLDLFVTKESPLAVKKISCELPSFIHLSLDHGRVFLKDTVEDKKFFAEIFSSDHDPSCYRVVSEKSKFLCSCTQSNENRIFSFDLTHASLEEIAMVKSFFLEDNRPFTKCSGDISGFFQVTFHENKSYSYFIDAIANELVLQTKQQKFFAEKLFFSSEYPVKKGDSVSSLSAFFFPGWQDTLISAEVVNGSLFFAKESYINEIKAKIVLNPTIGPKMYLFSKDPKGQTLACNIRGYFHSKKANWLDASLEVNGDIIACNTLEKPSGGIQLHFMCNQVANEKFHCIQKALSCLYGKKVEPISLEGKTSIDAFLDYEQGQYTELQVKTMLLEDIFIKMPQKDLELFVEKCTLQASCDLSEKNYDALCAKCAIDNGKMVYLGYTVEDFRTLLTIDHGYITPSRSFFSFADLTNHVEISGPVEECSLTSLVKGKTGAFFQQYIPGKKVVDAPLSASISLKRKNQEALIFGNMQIGEEEISFGLDIGLLPEKFCEVHHGWMRAKEISLENYQIFFEDVYIHGYADVSMQYQKGRADFSLSGANYSLKTRCIEFALHRTSNISFSYDFINRCWDLDALMQNASLHIPKLGLLFENMQGPLSVRKNFLKAAHITCNYQELALGGDIYLDLHNQAKLDVHCKKLEGPIRSLQSFCAEKLGICLGELDGKITAFGDGCYFSTNFLEEMSWGCSLSLQQGCLPLHDQAQLTDFSGKICYRSDSSLSSFASLKGILDLHGKKYVCSLPYLQGAEDGSYIFDVRLEENYWDVMRASGTVYYDEQGLWKCLFTPNKTEIFGEKVDIQQCAFTSFGTLESCSLQTCFSLSSFTERLPFLLSCFCLNDFNFFSLQQQPMQGMLEANFSIDKKNASLTVKGKDLTFQDYSANSLFICANSIANGWHISRFALDDLSAEFSCYYDGNIPQLFLYDKQEKLAEMEITHKGQGRFLMEVKSVEMDMRDLASLFPKDQVIRGKVAASGYAEVELPAKQRPWKFDLDLDMQPQTLYYKNSWECTNRSLVHLSYSLADGLLVTGLDFSALNPSLDRDDLRFQVGSVAYEKGDYFFKDVAFYIPQDMLFSLLASYDLPKVFLDSVQEMSKESTDIRISADLRVRDTGDSLFCTMADLTIPVVEGMYRFEDVAFSVTNRMFFWQCYVPLADSYYRLQLEMQRDQNYKGRMVFEESNIQDLPLIITWEKGDNEQFYCQSIEGAFCGLDASFHQSDEPRTLSGSLKVDFAKAALLLPQKIADTIATYDLAKGYELRGKLHLDIDRWDYAFEGICSGKQFEAMGYTFKTLLSQINYSSSKLQITDLKISDSSGIVKIAEMSCMKEDEDWHLSIPHIRVKEFRPSLLQEIDKPLGPIQPLVVRDMNLHDCKWNLSDPRACTASGKLHFINSFKRGHSVFDIPADILGRIFGLDLELLIPVKGDVTFAIQEGKVILTELSNSFSQGDRSQFFLAEKRGEWPFMDLDGELNIYIKMKQFVLFKFTENFIISITGKLHAPKFGLERKSSFFSS